MILLLLNRSEIFHVMTTTLKKKCCMKTIKQMQIKRETRRRKSPSVLQMAFEQYSMFRKMQREKESSVLIIFNVINKHVIIMAFFA